MLATARNNNKSIKSFKPVAIFAGGTSGIGMGAALKLAELTSAEKIIITGRNKESGEKIVAQLNELTHHTNNEFVPCDVTLMKNVKKYTDEIKQKIHKLNYLVLTTSVGQISFTRKDTEEGIDENLASGFYARFLITKELLPLLQAAVDAGEEARVITVLAAGSEGDINLDDLDFRKNFGYNVVGALNTYCSLTTEQFAIENPQISFMHAYPGWVDTGMAKRFPLITRP